jgi:iron complex outermembrane recepter protein
MRQRLSLIGTLCTFTAIRALSAQPTGELSGRVTVKGSTEPIAGVTVQVGGSAIGTITRNDGTYRLALRPGSYELRVRLIGFTSQRDSVRVVSGQRLTRDYAMVKAPMQLDAVAVTGTRAEERTVTRSPVPVDVLSAKELTQSGRTETGQMIQMVAPSFNFARATVQNGADFMRPATLRGLAPDQMLVLVNGKRRYHSALINTNSQGRGATGVDFNAIPASMIERIEVLRDGAAAQYGSDAIAGVINVILKSTAAGGFSATAGQNYSPWEVPVAGTRYSQWANATATDGDVLQATADYGLNFGNSSFLHMGVEFRDRGYSNRSFPDERRNYFANDPREATWNRNVHIQGDADTRDLVAMMNGGVTFANGVQLYSFASAGRRRGDGNGFYRYASDLARNLPELFPDGHMPFTRSILNDASGALGAKGTAKGWRWDASSTFGRSGFDFSPFNTVNVTLGPSVRKTSFYSGQLVNAQWTNNLDFFREVSWKAKPVRLATGAEYRWENYQIQAGEPDSWRDGGYRPRNPTTNAVILPAVGAQMFPGIRPTDESNSRRTNVGVYADVESDLSEKVLVSGAARFENYSDFGAATTGKLAARWSLTKVVALRGAVATGFRAPSLAQSFFTATTTVFPQGIARDTKTFPVASREAQLLGARPLQEETSRSVSAGITLEPMRTLTFTIDAYQIGVADRVILSEAFTGQPVRDFFQQNGITGLEGGRYFTNALDTRTRGVDVITNYGHDFGKRGIFRATAAINLNRTIITGVNQNTPPQLANLGEGLIGRTERARIEESQPRDNIILNGSHEIGRYTFTARTQRFGSVAARPQLVAAGQRQVPDQVWSPKWISDLSATVRMARRMTLGIGADNVFNVYPDRNNSPPDLAVTPQYQGNWNFGVYPYSGISPFGINGRYVWTRVGVGF